MILKKKGQVKGKKFDIWGYFLTSYDIIGHEKSPLNEGFCYVVNSLDFIKWWIVRGLNALILSHLFDYWNTDGILKQGV